MAITDADWVRATLLIHSTIGQAIESLNTSGLKIVLILNEHNKLLGTITDGDIRRAVLKGKKLTDNLSEIIQREPIICTREMSKTEIVDLMIAHKIFQIPVVDDAGKIIGLNIWSKLFEQPNTKNNYFVIMAGGKGTRLYPYTESCPKAMVKIGAKPMIQLIIERAKSEGFFNFYISINHLGHLIEDYLGDGSKFGVRIRYLKEKDFLGTAGSLSLLEERPELPIVVTNCDVVGDLSYSGILDFHNANLASATMGVKIYDWKNPFGVIKLDDLNIIKIDEKPVQSFVINAGVYVINLRAINRIMSMHSKIDMTDVFRQLISKGENVKAYPLHERWIDVGRPEDLKKIIDDLL